MLEHIKVGSNTNQSLLAGAIANAIRTRGTTLVSCVGQKALYQAVRGLVIARRFLLKDGIEIFTQIDIESSGTSESSEEQNSEEIRSIVKISVTSKKVGE